jgi:hypothetical protein
MGHPSLTGVSLLRGVCLSMWLFVCQIFLAGPVMAIAAHLSIPMWLGGILRLGAFVGATYGGLLIALFVTRRAIRGHVRLAALTMAGLAVGVGTGYLLQTFVYYDIAIIFALAFGNVLGGLLASTSESWPSPKASSYSNPV